MQAVLEKLFLKDQLSESELLSVFEPMMRGELSDILISAFLVAFRSKGETIDEIISLIKIIKTFSNTISIKDSEAIDTCGTGGAPKKAFNVSTASAFVLAAGGVTVAKHGNRSNARPSGSSDVLSALGVNIQMSAEETQRKIDKYGIGFLFAPLYHPSMKNVAAVRKELGIRTVFNLLGPLLNPANVQRQIIGVFEESLIDTYIHILKKLGHKKAIVVHGLDGYDEFSLTGSSKYALLENGIISYHTFQPEDLGLSRVNETELQGDNPQVNATIIEAILKGEVGPKSDLVALNAAAGFFIAGKVKSIQEGLKMAQDILKSGKSYTKLEQLKFS